MPLGNGLFDCIRVELALDKSAAVSISATGPSYSGTVTALNAGDKTLTLGITVAKDQIEDKTFTLASTVDLTDIAAGPREGKGNY
jgi:hypothetical protein